MAGWSQVGAKQSKGRLQVQTANLAHRRSAHWAAQDCSWASAVTAVAGRLQDRQTTEHEEGDFVHCKQLPKRQNLAATDAAFEARLLDPRGDRRLSEYDGAEPWILLSRSAFHARREHEPSWSRQGGRRGHQRKTHSAAGLWGAGFQREAGLRPFIVLFRLL